MTFHDRDVLQFAIGDTLTNTLKSCFQKFQNFEIQMQIMFGKQPENIIVRKTTLTRTLLFGKQHCFPNIIVRKTTLLFGKQCSEKK